MIAPRGSYAVLCHINLMFCYPDTEKKLSIYIAISRSFLSAWVPIAKLLGKQQTTHVAGARHRRSLLVAGATVQKTVSVLLLFHFQTYLLLASS